MITFFSETAQETLKTALDDVTTFKDKHFYTVEQFIRDRLRGEGCNSFTRPVLTEKHRELFLNIKNEKDLMDFIKVLEEYANIIYNTEQVKESL